MARLAAKQQTSVVPLSRCITAHGHSMARLLNAARAIFGLPGIFKSLTTVDANADSNIASMIELN